MSKPEIPERTQEEALTDLLESIALEETALAHFLNAEAEKIQSVAKKCKITPKEMIEFQKSVSKVMRSAIKKEMLLQFKLEDVLEFKEKKELKKPCSKLKGECTSKKVTSKVTSSSTEETDED
ncbi:hypothetical protein [Fuchsiella alkaliacetigena]|uniref:hypothetical protein n=1 Tax=Fuchsiella alkaliacetigena TaxID=957042 RepID=UPI00200AEBDE|nr:hypothetical protein [Fuchsiella alkaliacetigena]MCK8824195.1 hypothetical protein [Fuchsiella alkaliacetigena]